MNHIVFDYEQLEPFVAWLKEEPAGEWHVTIGNAIDGDLAWVVGSVAELGSWALAERLVARLKAGEITVEAQQGPVAEV